MFRHWPTEQNHDIKVDSKSFENIAKLTYLGMILMHQRCIHEGIKNRLNLWSTCYHAVQDTLFS